MRTLPKNIYENGGSGGGWVVRVWRRGVKFIACVPFGPDRAASLAVAVAKRDRFLALHGRVSIVRPRSNTGITGISEVTKWFHSRPHDCFQVTTGNPRTSGMKRFFYRGLGDRAGALRAAIAYRAQRLGVTEAEVQS